MPSSAWMLWWLCSPRTSTTAIGLTRRWESQSDRVPLIAVRLGCDHMASWVRGKGSAGVAGLTRTALRSTCSICSTSDCRIKAGCLNLLLRPMPNQEVSPIRRGRSSICLSSFRDLQLPSGRTGACSLPSEWPEQEFLQGDGPASAALDAARTGKTWTVVNNELSTAKQKQRIFRSSQHSTSDETAIRHDSTIPTTPYCGG